MSKSCIPAILAASLLFSASSHATLEMGMVGDSLTDDYLGGPARANNNLAAYSWGQILAVTRPADFSFGGYKAVGDIWDNKIRYSGYQNNWATSGGVASDNSKANVVGLGGISVNLFGASYLSSQTTGLAQQITNGEINTAFAGIGSNDFFYHTTLFDMSGASQPDPNAVIDQIFINDIANAIINNLDKLHDAGTNAGHPVDLVLGLIPAGTAGGSSPDILAGIRAVNQQLIEAAATRNIPTLDLFGWTSDKTRVDKNGAVHIGHLVITPDSSASDADISPSGTGPCNTNGCALPSHANHFRADDGLHPNTIIQAFIANQVIATLNSAYGHTIAPITDAEILALVGVALPVACQNDADGDGLANGSYMFSATTCAANAVQVPLITNTERLGATLQSDNCPYAANADQQDSNADGVGDVCQGDRDSDNISNANDNCQTAPNNDQLNTDADTLGDACDADDDNDSINDDSDAFPLDATENTDSDSDGIGDNADNCPFTANAGQPDTDGDSLGDACDNYPMDNSLLLEKYGDTARENFASSIAIADMNNDGVPDLLVGSPMKNVTTRLATLKKAGAISILSGVDGSTIRTLYGSSARQHFGTAIAAVDDRNGDGIPDIVVGEPQADISVTHGAGKRTSIKAAGRVALYSGSNGGLLKVLVEGKAPADHLGAAVAVGLVDSDAIADLVVGVPGSDTNARNAGHVTVFNGISQTELYSLNGEQSGEGFGSAIAIDNHLLYLGAPGYSPKAAPAAGRVLVYNGTSSSAPPLLSVEGTHKGDRFGAAVSAHQGKWAAGAPMADLSGKNAGAVLVFESATPPPSHVLTGSHSGDQFGSSLNFGADLNRDNENDLTIGANRSDAHPDTGKRPVTLGAAGLLRVISGNNLTD